MAVLEAGSDLTTREKMDKVGKKQVLSDKKLVATTQDIKYARCLSDNNKKIRDKALKALKKWFQHRCQSMLFTELELMLIWKGLFYSMWMSDKLLIQEECAEGISQLIHSLTPEQSLLYFKTGLKTLGNEWFGIDQWRLDKFMMLVRRLLRQGFEVLKSESWKMQHVKQFQKILEDTVLNTKETRTIGLTLHFIEIYLEEFAKIAQGKTFDTVVTTLVTPFIKLLAFSSEPRLMKAIMHYVFTHLMNQSDIGIEHAEKFEAWSKMRFVGGDINKLQKADDSDDDESQGDEEEIIEDEESGNVLDPRAGKVDVVLPQIKFSSKQIINVAQNYKFHADTTTKSRKFINNLIDNYKEFSKGKYPLGIKKVELAKDEHRIKLKNSARKLQEFDKKIKSEKRPNIFEDLEDEPKSKKSKNAVTEQIESIIKGKHKKKKTLNGELKTEEKKVRKHNNVQLKQAEKKTLNRKKKNVEDVIPKPKELENLYLESSFARNSGVWFVHTESPGDTSLNTNSETTKVLSMHGDGLQKRKRTKENFNDTKEKSSSFEVLKRSSSCVDPPQEISSELGQNKSLLSSPTASRKSLCSPRKSIRNLDSSVSSMKYLNGFLSPLNQAQSNQDLGGSNFKPSLSSPKQSSISVIETKQGQSSPSKPKQDLSSSIQSKQNLKPSSTSSDDSKVLSPTKTTRSSPNLSKQVQTTKKGLHIQTFHPIEVSTLQQQTFPQSEWDVPLKDGESEIFIPSNKYKKRMEILAKQTNQNVSDLISASLKKLKTKSRHSLDPNLIHNSYAKSPKRVKINLRLNKSQEIYEHVARIKNSPAIPFDANAKPDKSLLKINNSGPINPFYKSQL